MCIYRYKKIILNLKNINYVNLKCINGKWNIMLLHNTYYKEHKTLIEFSIEKIANEELNKIHHIMKLIK